MLSLVFGATLASGWWNGSHFVMPPPLAGDQRPNSCWSQEWTDHSCNGYLAGGQATSAEQCCTMCKGYKGCTYATYDPSTHYSCLAQPDWKDHGGQPDKNVQVASRA